MSLFFLLKPSSWDNVVGPDVKEPATKARLSKDEIFEDMKRRERKRKREEEEMILLLVSELLDE